MKIKILLLIIVLLSIVPFIRPRTDTDVISLFPLAHYSQRITDWIRPGDSDYDELLLTPSVAEQRFNNYFEHVFGIISPWSPGYINKIVSVSANIKMVEQEIIMSFTNQGKAEDKIGYGENFSPYGPEWINGLSNIIPLNQLANLQYQANHRAIAIDNLPLRFLPTDDVYFYHHQLPGQGYPFDNMQVSVVWAGTPLYVLIESMDHAWSLVVTPDVIAWVKTNGIASVDDAFVATWQVAAKKQLIAITRTQTSIVDAKGQFAFSAYVGSVFPADDSSSATKILFPAMGSDHQAVIQHATLPEESSVNMPLTATPHHFADVIKTLLGRPYGWGGLYFYNDCSSELKNLLTPFAIWLPRHSTQQVTAGKVVDMTAAKDTERLRYLFDNGKRFITIVYIGGHVFMYVGHDKKTMMTYQNMWGLSPNPPVRRAVIGKAVFFPLLLQYKEDKSLVSPVNKKYFQVAYLDELSTLEAATGNALLQTHAVDVRALMGGE